MLEHKLAKLRVRFEAADPSAIKLSTVMGQLMRLAMPDIRSVIEDIRRTR